MGESDISNTLQIIHENILEIKNVMSKCTRRRLPEPCGYNPMGKGKCLSQRLRGGLKDPEVRAAIMRLKKEGNRFKDIAAYLKKRWPGQPEKHVPQSTCHRFYQSAMRGRLQEYGIEPPVEL